MEPLHLLCAADARYGAYAGIMLGSVLHSNPGEVFHFHVLSNGIRQRDQRRIAALADRAGSGCTIYDVGGRLAARADPAAYHLSRTAYARLLISDVLPPNIHRVIYLDCDIICVGKLAGLWKLGEAVPVLGAVVDHAGAPWRARLGLPGDARYFNSGVLLVNLDSWRERGLGQTIIDWIEKNPDRLVLADQDAINACLADSITPLPGCWNLQIGKHIGVPPAGRLSGAVLLHYCGEHKPWGFRFRGVGADIFLRQKRHSPWRFKLPTFRLVQRLRKMRYKRRARARPATTS